MKRPKSTRSKFLRVSSLAAIGWALILQASLATAQVEPPAYEDTLAPGQFNDIAKTVQTPEIPARPDIIFLADTTGSMGPAILNVQTNAAAIMTAVDVGTSGTPYFAAAEYRDFGDSFVFAVNQTLTSDQGAVNAGIATWNAAEGGDTPEAQLNALGQLATGAAGAFRDGATPVIVWFGDASGNDPSGPWTEASATAALVAAEIIVIAIDVDSGLADGLDAAGQATRITNATGGSFSVSTPPSEVAQAILDALSNLPITVIPTPVGCDPLDVSFDPTSDTVTSGEVANFTETITVPGNSAFAGQTVECTVEFRDENGGLIGIQEISIDIPLAIDLTPDEARNELSEDNMHTVDAYVSSLDVPLGLGGKIVDFEVTGTNAATANPGSDSSLTDDAGLTSFSYTVLRSCNSLGTDVIEGCTDRADEAFLVCDRVIKHWEDTIAPVAQCVETVNPHGNKKPKAPGEGGQGQNQDGFYELLADDNLVEGCAPLELWVTDDGTGTPFGPFPVGTKIKYTQDDDRPPEIAPMGGNNGNGNGQGNAVDWHIWGHGDAVLTAVDQSGNVSDPVNCLVPPPPQ